MLSAVLLLTVAADFDAVSGVKVRCLENLRGKVGRARVEVVVGAGAMHEAPNARGVAHLLEHLLLRPLGFDDSNGATGWDYTTYYRDVRGAELSTAAVDLVQALGDVSFDAGTFDTERNVVLRELEERGADIRFENDPMFSGTVLERAPGGTLAAVRDLDVEDARRFHADHYTKGNVAVLLSGAVSCGAIVRRLTPLLERIPDGDASDVPRVEEKEPGPFPLPPSEDLLIQGFYWFDASPTEEVLWHLIAKDLEQRALDELRKERGIAYSPSARVMRRGTGGIMELKVKTDSQANEAAAWFEEQVEALRATSSPKQRFAQAMGPARVALGDDNVRNALAAIRGEPAPTKILDELDDVTAAESMARLLVDRRSFGTAAPQSSVWTIIILVLFGAVVLGVLGFVAKDLLG
ncbi:MAG: insulinase family protein [Deltaproteobacteria bacterium]